VNGKPQVRGRLIRAAAHDVKEPAAAGVTPALVPGDLLEDANQMVVAEIAVLHDRLERDLRSLIRATLQAAEEDESWRDAILKSLPGKRRTAVNDLAGNKLMTALYFLEFKQIVAKNWTHFARRFGDRGRFEAAMNIANTRPFAHPKDYDLADLALFRREYRWLQERVDS
jgi:hypothetical protein